jgi:hypothetical protein
MQINATQTPQAKCKLERANATKAAAKHQQATPPMDKRNFTIMLTSLCNDVVPSIKTTPVNMHMMTPSLLMMCHGSKLSMSDISFDNNDTPRGKLRLRQHHAPTQNPYTPQTCSRDSWKKRFVQTSGPSNTTGRETANKNYISGIYKDFLGV